MTAATPALAQTAPADQPQIVLHSGRIHTMDANDTVVEAIAIRDGRVLAVGSSRAIKPLAGATTIMVDLRGRTVTPGLIDGNIHGTRGAYYCWTSNIRIDFIRDREAALAEIARTARANKPGTWLWTTRLPAMFHIDGLDPPGMFTLDELDRAAPRNPVMIMANGFGPNAQLNSAAIAALGLKPGDPAFAATGKIGMPTLDRARAALAEQFEALTLKDQANCYLDFSRAMNAAGLTAYAGAQQGGRFNGGAWGAGAGVPRAQTDTASDVPAASPAYRAEALAAGVPAESIDRARAEPSNSQIFDYDNNPNRDGLKPVVELLRANLLTTRITAMLDPRGGGFDGVRMTAYHSIGLVGDDMLRIGGMGPGFFMTRVKFGNTATLLPPADEYARIVEFMACNRWNWTDQTYLEATVRYKLDVIERANVKCPIAGLRWSFEGIQEPLAPRSLARIRALGLGVTTFATNIQGNSPLPDVKGPTPFADLEKSGVIWCMASDGTLGNPAQPFGHLWYAVTGETMNPNGLKQPPNQRLTRHAALRAKTTNCRFHLQNDRIGALVPGSHGDLAVLSEDYFMVDADRIREIGSVLTLVGGRIVYASGPFAALDDAFETDVARFKAKPSF